MAMNERLLAELLGLATQCFLCGFWFLPEGVLALRRRAHGELQVDTRLGYSPETLYPNYGSWCAFWLMRIVHY
jgi:hypothetical protein